MVEKDRKAGLARVDAAERDVHELEETIRKEKMAMDEEVQEMIQTYKNFENKILEKNIALMTATLTI